MGSYRIVSQRLSVAATRNCWMESCPFPPSLRTSCRFKGNFEVLILTAKKIQIFLINTAAEMLSGLFHPDWNLPMRRRLFNHKRSEENVPKIETNPTAENTYI